MYTKMGGKTTKQSGYTIVEVMIFLAVSSIIAITALLMFERSQRETEFVQAMRDIDSKIRDVINDVETGVYNYPANFECTASASGADHPTITDPGATVDNQGSNQGCLFIGRVFQFGTDTDKSALDIYTVAGRQYTGAVYTSDEVTSLFEAKPTPIAPRSGSPGVPSATESSRLGYGIVPTSITYGSSFASDMAIGAFGVFTNFAVGVTESGSQQTDLWVVVPSSRDVTRLEAADQIYNMQTGSFFGYRNPSDGIKLCFANGDGDRFGRIDIGTQDQGDRLTTSLVIGRGTC